MHQLVAHLAHLGPSAWLSLRHHLARALTLPSTQPWVGSRSHWRSHLTVSANSKVQLVLRQVQGALRCCLLRSTSSHHVLHLLHLLKLHLLHLLVHALNLNEALHVSWTSSHALTLTIDPQALDSTKASLPYFTWHIHCLRSLLILHVTIFQIIEDTIEINCV